MTSDSASVGKSAKKDLPTPYARRGPVIRSFHGRDFTDSFEQLHDKENPGVVEYLGAENVYTEVFTSDLGDTAGAIFKKTKPRVQEVDMSVPTRLNGWQCYLCTQEGKPCGMSCRVYAEAGDDLATWTSPTIVSDSSASGEQVILNASELAEGCDFFALGAASVSMDGNLSTYSTDVAGDERCTSRIKDLHTGELLDNEIADITADATQVSSGWVFYQKVDKIWRPDFVWRHHVDTSAEDDVCVSHESDETYWVGVDTARSERHLIIKSPSKITSEAWYPDVSDPTSEFTCVRPRKSGIEYDVNHTVIRGQDMWLIIHNTTGSNPALTMMLVGFFDSILGSTGLVVRCDDIRVESVDCFAGYITFECRRGGIGRMALAVLAQDENDAGSAEMGDATNLVPAFAANFVESEFDEEFYSASTVGNAEWGTPVLRYAYDSSTTPSQFWQIDIIPGEQVPLEGQKVRREFDRDDYIAKRK